MPARFSEPSTTFSVKAIEEVFSFLEKSCFKPVYVPAEADFSQIERLHAWAALDKRKAVASRRERSLRRLQAYKQEVDRTRALYASAGEGLAIGADEVGRGPLAGPVVVCALALPPASELCLLGLDDSKKLTPQKRQELAQTIKAYALAFSIKSRSNTEIDALGIAEATRQAFSDAVFEVQKACDSKFSNRSFKVCIDGLPLHLCPEEEAIVKGDAKVASIAAASIVAKVARDTYMEEMSALYPDYGFEKHKGYGSAAHREAIQKRGLTPLHRVSFCTRFTSP